MSYVLDAFSMKSSMKRSFSISSRFKYISAIPARSVRANLNFNDSRGVNLSACFSLKSVKASDNTVLLCIDIRSLCCLKLTALSAGD